VVALDPVVDADEDSAVVGSTASGWMKTFLIPGIVMCLWGAGGRRRLNSLC
jgi:hypothetical protein